MIKVIFKKKCNYLVSFDINGHAGYDYEGYDIVCSAISALSIAISNGITEIVGVKAEICEHDGYLNLDLDGQSVAEAQKCQVLMETMLLGVKNIEDNYRDYIKLEVKEVR